MSPSSASTGLLFAMFISWSAAKDTLQPSHLMDSSNGRSNMFWSDWSTWSPCTRSCGGGVSMRSRICHRRLPGSNGKGDQSCHEEDVEHKICNRYECPPGSVDYRHYQCAQYNNRKVAGQVTREWLPQNGADHNPCELRCHSPSLGLAYSFGKAADGTRCLPGRDDICLNGRCMPVGCDDLIGSKVGLDMCGVCGGRNATCIHYKDVYLGQPEVPQDSRSEPRAAYHEVSVIPIGATHIYVHHSSTNYLAVRDRANAMVFNRRSDMPDSFRVAGTVVTYAKHDNNSETLQSPGPTDQDLYVMVLLKDRNPGIYYEYWLPKNTYEPRLIDTPRPTLSSPPFKSVPYSPPNQLPSPQGPNRVLSDRDRMQPATPPPTATKPNYKPRIKNTAIPYRPTPQSTTPRAGPRPGGWPPRHGGVNSSPARNNFNDHLQEGSVHDYKSGRSTRRPFSTPRTNRAPGPDYNRYWTSSSSRWTYSWEDEKLSKHQRGRPTPTPITVAVLQLPDTSRNGTRSKEEKCRPCHRMKDQIKGFCTSDFVLRVSVVGHEVIHGETRYETQVLQSFKNTMAILPREYIWTPEACRCPKLKVGREYILMGRADHGFRRNESRLLVDRSSFVRPFSLKNAKRLFRLRRDQKRKCRKVS